LKHYGFLVTIALMGSLLSGCDSGESTSADTAKSTVTGQITVFAGASLTESFTTIGQRFEADHPGVKVVFNFAGGPTLATQINQGAPADVFASASPANMKTVTDAGNGESPAVVFVRNQLVIAVPKGNPKRISALSDLTKPSVKVALCAEQVPCGSAAKRATAAANLTITPVTFEQDVKATLSKVKLGEVDAALVYRTDTKAASASVDGIEFPESASAINDYPIVVLKNAPNHPGAVAFVEYVRSEPAMAVLTAAGFQAP
jgi:molybdate transport system substrate-binding protein